MHTYVCMHRYVYVCAHAYKHNMVYFIAVASVQQQPEKKIVSIKEEDTNNKLASSSSDVDIPSPIKTVESDDNALPNDSEDLKKSHKWSEDGDMELELDKSAEPSGDGESVTSEKNAKECSTVTSQAVTFTEATLPGMYICMHSNYILNTCMNICTYIRTGVYTVIIYFVFIVK